MGINTVDLEGTGLKPVPFLPSLFIAYPFTRPHYDDFLRSVVNIAASPGGIGAMDLHSIFGFSIDVARNALVETFLKGNADYMLMLDNDCKFAVEGVDRLLSHQLPVVCGGMYTRAIPPKPTAGTYLGKNEEGKHIYKFAGVAKDIVRKARKFVDDPSKITNDIVLPQEEGDLKPIDGCGMHFTLIRRDVFETVKPPWFVFEYGVQGGEDFYFCRKAKEMGFDIAIDISVHSGHIDSEDHDYGIRELLLMMKYLDLETDILKEQNWEI